MFMIEMLVDARFWRGRVTHITTKTNPLEIVSYLCVAQRLDIIANKFSNPPN